MLFKNLSSGLFLAYPSPHISSLPLSLSLCAFFLMRSHTHTSLKEHFINRRCWCVHLFIFSFFSTDQNSLVCLSILALLLYWLQAWMCKCFDCSLVPSPKIPIFSVHLPSVPPTSTRIPLHPSFHHWSVLSFCCPLLYKKCSDSFRLPPYTKGVINEYRSKGEFCVKVTQLCFRKQLKIMK